MMHCFRLLKNKKLRLQNKYRITIFLIVLSVFHHDFLFSQTSGSITQGLGVTATANLMPSCASNHVTPVGNIKSTDNKDWIVPAETNFVGGTKLTDLHNECNGIIPSSLAAANLSAMPTTIIDASGDVITGYIFADNYFELYINGVLVGVDPVPFTPFNSCAVRFKVSMPYTIAVKLVDWEENLGLGSEIQSATKLFHPGDGGFIAQFSDGTVTDASWKVQTFYLAPIQDLNTVIEKPDGTRSTATASVTPTCNANCYGVHYAIPTTWNSVGFNDNPWPSATLYTAAQVTNSISYTNFATTAWPNAKFIWSSNLILDNIVLARKTILQNNGIKPKSDFKKLQISNPFNSVIKLKLNGEEFAFTALLCDLRGNIIQEWKECNFNFTNECILNLNAILANGVYVLQIKSEIINYATKLMQQNQY